MPYPNFKKGIMIKPTEKQINYLMLLAKKINRSNPTNVINSYIMNYTSYSNYKDCDKVTISRIIGTIKYDLNRPIKQKLKLIKGGSELAWEKKELLKKLQRKVERYIKGTKSTDSVNEILCKVRGKLRTLSENTSQRKFDALFRLEHELEEFLKEEKKVDSLMDVTIYKGSE